MHPEFLNIWLSQKSWAPIILTHPHGWQTLKNPKGKAIPLATNHLHRAYDQHGDIVGKRFGRFTNYLMIDIDRGSQYHPVSDGPGVILEAMEGIGLVEHIKVRSSASQGIHLYFPLEQAIKTWELAKRAHAALKQSSVAIANGTCELFPNKKAWSAGDGIRTEYNGHRLPLQNGSFILGEDWQPVSDDQGLFVKQWETAARRNECHGLDVQETTWNLRRIATSDLSKQLPPLPKFTGPSQTNEILRKLANYGSRYLSLVTVPELARWIKETVSTLPGYEQHCSKESLKDIERNWCSRWAKSCLNSGRQYKAKVQGPNHNQVVADDAQARLRACIARVTGETFTGIKHLFHRLRETGIELHGVGVGWPTFSKLRNLWEHLAQSSAGGMGTLGAPPPTGQSEPKAAHTVINRDGMCSQSGQGFQPSHPPAEQSIDQELPPGSTVEVWLPGCPSHGLRTVIKSRQWDNCGRRVYRLGERLAGRLMELPMECLRVV